MGWAAGGEAAGACTVNGADAGVDVTAAGAFAGAAACAAFSARNSFSRAVMRSAIARSSRRISSCDADEDCAGGSAAWSAPAPSSEAARIVGVHSRTHSVFAMGLPPKPIDLTHLLDPGWLSEGRAGGAHRRMAGLDGTPRASGRGAHAPRLTLTREVIPLVICNFDPLCK